MSAFLLFGKKIHFVGVGGISMSAMAKICAGLGAQVTGSDSNLAAVEALKAQGFEVYAGQKPHYAESADIVCYNAAIPRDNAELIAAGDKAVPRAEFLAKLSEVFKKTVAVSGTHGKTTVTAMLSAVFAAAGRGYCAHIGGIARNFNNNAVLCGKRYFITEACEYKDSFLTLSPDVALVLNVEYDHGDYFKDIDEVRKSFSRFVSGVKNGGFAVLGEGVADCIDTSSYEHIGIYSYGKDFWAESLGEGRFLLKIAGKEPIAFTTHQAGGGSVYNAAMCAFTALKMGIDEADVRFGLEGFLGVKRRFECLGKSAKKATVITDYAHHPTEIAALINAARGVTKGRVIVAFEPHTYSRTKTLFEEFEASLRLADSVVILPTFPARETPSDGMNGLQLYYGLDVRNKYYAGNYEVCKLLIDKIARSRDVVLTVGAGTVDKLGEMLVEGV